MLERVNPRLRGVRKRSSRGGPCILDYQQKAAATEDGRGAFR